MGILMELGVPDPVPALNVPAVAHQLHHGLWGGVKAGVAPSVAPGGSRQMAGVKGCGFTGAAGFDFHDPVGADPGLSDVLRCLNRCAEVFGYGA